MKPEIKALQRALQNRKAELQELISQMKADQLNKGHVFKNLNDELNEVKNKLEKETSKTGNDTRLI